MVIHARVRRWATAACLVGIGLSGVLMYPTNSPADTGRGSYSRHHREHEGDFASRMFRALLSEQKELKLSPEQIGRIEALSTDYAKTSIRDSAAEKLAEVDVRALMRNEQSDLTTIEAALQKAESARTTARLDRVKAIRSVMAVLTAEQRDMWRAKIKERHGEGRRGLACADESAGDQLMKRLG